MVFVDNIYIDTSHIFHLATTLSIFFFSFYVICTEIKNQLHKTSCVNFFNKGKWMTKSTLIHASGVSRYMEPAFFYELQNTSNNRFMNHDDLF